MISYYQDLATRAISLYDQGSVTFEEKLEFFSNLTEISEFLDKSQEDISRIDRVSLAAYGFSYRSISWDSVRVVEGLREVIPSATEVLRDHEMPRSVRFNLSSMDGPFRKNARDFLELGLEVLEKMKEAMDNRKDLYAASVRYSEDSDLWSYDPVTVVFSHLCTRTMTATRYRFEDFQCYISTGEVSEYHGDTWPILKDMFPELYV